MKIIERLLESLDYNAEVRDIRLGPFQSAVLTRNCGLASTITGVTPGQHEQQPLPEAGSLLKKSARELAELALAEDPLAATVGMATINSLLGIDTAVCTQLNAFELLRSKGKGRNVAIVGHFPFVGRLRESAGQLWVIEKNPRPGDISEAEGNAVLPRADVIGITGSALTNHTLEPLLKLCRRDAYVILLGGTAPLTPVLFESGIDAVAGTRVEDAAGVLRAAGQGATYRQLPGITKLLMIK